MTSVASRRSAWDRYLTLLIYAAMVLDVGLAWAAPVADMKRRRTHRVITIGRAAPRPRA